MVSQEQRGAVQRDLGHLPPPGPRPRPPPGRPNAQSPRYIAQLGDACLMVRPRPTPTFTHTPPVPSPGYGRDAIGR